MLWIMQDSTLGKNIKTFRQNKKMTKQDVVDILKLKGSLINITSLMHIEAGRKNISYTDLVALSALLEVDYSDFFKQ